MVMGGNREGTLEAFTIKAIPAYNFNIISDKPDMKRIKEWMKIDEKDDDKPLVKKGTVKPKTSPADYAQAVANANWK